MRAASLDARPRRSDSPTGRFVTPQEHADAAARSLAPLGQHHQHQSVVDSGMLESAVTRQPAAGPVQAGRQAAVEAPRTACGFAGTA